MPNEIPPVSRDDIIAFQDTFRLSDTQLAAGLGYPGQPDIVRRWKAGRKGRDDQGEPKPFVMAASARAAFWYLKALFEIMEGGFTLSDEISSILVKAIPGFIR
jgi:hypothetical protein